MSLNCFKRGWKVVPVNRDEPVGLEVCFPLVLDHLLDHFSKGVSSGVDPLKFSVQLGSGRSLVLEVLIVFWSGFYLIPSFHSGMSLTSFGTGSGYGHKYVRCIGIRSFMDFLNSYEFLHSLP